MKYAACVALLIALCGCTTTKRDSAHEAFRHRYPDTHHYYTLVQTSVAGLYMVLDYSRDQESTILDSAERNIPGSDELTGWLAFSRKRMDEIDASGKEWISALLAQLSNEDTVHFYVYDDGKSEDEGILVLRNGKMIVKESQPYPSVRRAFEATDYR